jgi:hypothetical protein
MVRDAINTGARVRIEATSYHGGEYDGPVSELPAGVKVYFVGPDPYTSRRFYGTITHDGRGFYTVK